VPVVHSGAQESAKGRVPKPWTPTLQVQVQGCFFYVIVLRWGVPGQMYPSRVFVRRGNSNTDWRKPVSVCLGREYSVLKHCSSPPHKRLLAIGKCQRQPSRTTMVRDIRTCWVEAAAGRWCNYLLHSSTWPTTARRHPYSSYQRKNSSCYGFVRLLITSGNVPAVVVELVFIRDA
jgi:hypothetical protein